MQNWTEAQKTAINAKNCNLLVSAGAGAGKTAVLVERIYRLLLDEMLDIDQLLVVTFTKAAAGEMRDRLSKRMLQGLQNGDNEDHIRHQLMLLGKAQISTLHAFCTRVIKTWGYLLGTDSAFRTIDGVELENLKKECLDILLENEYASEKEEFLALVECLMTRKNDSILEEQIMQIYEFAWALPEPQAWLQEKIDLYTGDFENSHWHKLLMKQCNKLIFEAIQLSDEALKIAELANLNHHDLLVYQEENDCLLKIKSSLALGITDFVRQIQTLSFTSLNGKSGDQELKAKAKNKRDGYKAIVLENRELLQGFEFENWQIESQQIKKHLQIIVKLVMKFSKDFKIMKREKAVRSFTDLEHDALELLTINQVSSSYNKQFVYIFIDEYQDSNSLQEELIKKIARKNNIFAVGDIKQSIYRFRNANPALFIEKYNHYPRKNGASELCVLLSKNFRSSRNIVDLVNDLFSNLMNEDLGEIDYDDDAALISIKKEEISHPIEVILIDGIKDEIIDKKLESELSDWTKIEKQALVIGQKIEKLVKSGTYKYCDIAILSRGLKAEAQILERILHELGIPVFTDVSVGYFATYEISLIIALLKLIDNKQQDIPLISVARSPIGQFTIDELVSIRISEPEGAFYEAFCAFAVSESNLGKRAKAFIEKIRSWQKTSLYMKTDEFIWQLLQETRLFNYVGTMFRGKEKQANLELFYERARSFQTSGLSGLSIFLDYLKKYQNKKSDLGPAKILGEQDDIVQIMTIHKSKGLEFPVVFLFNLNKNFNLRDQSNDLLLQQELGFGVKISNYVLRSKGDNLYRRLLREVLHSQALSEEMRILYVALTRSKERLFLIGASRDLSKDTVRWKAGLNYDKRARATCYLDWLGPILMQHPDAIALRFLETGEEDVMVKEDFKSKIKIAILKNTDLVVLQHSELSKKERLHDLQNIGSANSILAAEINARLTWSYQWQANAVLPSKMTVTNLQGLYENSHENTSFQRLSTSQKINYDFKDVGKWNHKFMQLIDLKKVAGIEDIREQMDIFLAKGIINEEIKQLIELEKIAEFFASPLGKRLQSSSLVFREKSFQLLRGISDIAKEYAESKEKVLVQGTIDLFFVEQDGLVLVDYKTNMGNETIVSLREKYGLQIKIYQEALEKICRKPVIEAYIVLLNQNRQFEFLSY
ncbi:MAG: helicase-exonuclease AddAB subunit AddA [Clostridia bacterium]